MRTGAERLPTRRCHRRPLSQPLDSSPQIGGVLLRSPPAILTLCFPLSVWRLRVERAGKTRVLPVPGAREAPVTGRRTVERPSSSRASQRPLLLD